MSAAITPGIHPQMVNINTIKIEPQPLSMTANGGNRIARSTRQIFMVSKLRLKINYQLRLFPFPRFLICIPIVPIFATLF